MERGGAVGTAAVRWLDGGMFCGRGGVVRGAQVPGPLSSGLGGESNGRT
jgi:hypothetical protein